MSAKRPLYHQPTLLFSLKLFWALSTKWRDISPLIIQDRQQQQQPTSCNWFIFQKGNKRRTLFVVVPNEPSTHTPIHSEPRSNLYRGREHIKGTYYIRKEKKTKQQRTQMSSSSSKQKTKQLPRVCKKISNLFVSFPPFCFSFVGSFTNVRLIFCHILKSLSAWLLRAI